MKKIVFLVINIVVLTCLYSLIPPGYYDGTEGLSGDELKSVLNDIIDNHTELTYSQVWDALRDTDEDPENPENVILLYTGWSVTNAGYPTWNREHTWAKSHGGFDNDPPCGTDVHHLRPTDVQVNGDRGNLDFDYSDNPYPAIPTCFYDSDSWEPRDEVKGDVARMIFYMATRYEGENSELDLVVVDEVNTAPNPEHGKLSTLLEWNSLDPPSSFEETRNDRIYTNWQGNRNPFIDHPEFVGYIWGNTNPELTAEFTADITIGTAPLTVQFTDASYGSDIISWNWDMDGDNINDSTLQNPSFTYQNTGFFNVTLTVEDNLGNSSTITKENFIHVVQSGIPEIMLSESFESLIPEWYLISEASDQDWTITDEISIYTHPSTVPDGIYYAYANNYNSNAPANDWLITPVLDLTAYDDPYINFVAWTKFSDIIPGLEILVSANYTGEPNIADWTVLTADLPVPDSGTWQNSGDIDLSDFTEETINIAFHYTSSGTGTSTTTAWAVDDITVLGYEPSSVEENNPNISYYMNVYPNPIFNSSSVKMSYSIPAGAQTIQIKIYNIKGQKINQFSPSINSRSIFWNGADSENKIVGSGLYLINLSIDGKVVASKKCVILN
ncbi:MAG: endonuclease [Candidatus Cloacimonetes bacterium]|nr:endonuclease [Candidatus Cloacimonadota bacterium]